MAHLPASLQAELVGRLALAVLLGSVLGWERQMGRHPAGLRTHMLVALGAAAYTVAGAYGGWALLGGGVGTVEDPGRVAAQIITGVGFLGAGTIWRSSGDEGVIRGLTTAASIWVAASVGMLTGYGLYILAVGTAVLSLIVLRVIRRVERAPRVLGSVVARPFRQAHGRAWQPARAPSVMETPPPMPVETGGDATALDAAATASIPNGVAGTGGVYTGDQGVPDDLDLEITPESRASKKKRELLHKKLRKNTKSKKGGKGKRRDLPTDELDQISDAPPLTTNGG